jgi:hypothetical protein
MTGDAVFITGILSDQTVATRRHCNVRTMGNDFRKVDKLNRLSYGPGNSAYWPTGDFLAKSKEESV